ncbi:Ribonuclease H-like domain containing protein [Trema orientale]|uniref:Ribonuclease H-like domain containing protein n=1 Tax=Trema orientale TaxID=63057 RepID=A0A2P5D599_TREOI|nr:Ribonuclease H-like domain containing protein [Trema orientale]
MDELLLLFYKSFDRHEFEMFAVVLWHLWWERNKFVYKWGVMSLRDTGVLTLWAHCIEIFRSESMNELLLLFYKYFDRHEFEIFAVVLWHLWWERNKFFYKQTLAGVLKLNVDVACVENLGFIGVRGLIQDHCGAVHAAFSCKISGAFDPLVSELLAIRTGLQVAADLGLIISITESECSMVVALIRSPDGCSSSNLIPSDIVSLLREVGGGPYHLFPCTGNEAAHSLAKLAISCNSECFWVHDTSSCITNIVANDSLFQ